MRKLLLLLALLIPPVVFAQDATPTTSPEDELILRIWWPDQLYPSDNEQALRILEEQLSEFNKANPDYDVVLRLKATQGTGGILNTIMAAQPIAPNALPDLVLIQRNDLVPAARAGVIRQLEDWIPDTIRNDLLPPTLQLGYVDEVLYGLPYALWIEHLIYSPSLELETPLTLETLLDRKDRWWLPLMPPPNQEVSDMILAQYLAADGRLVDDSGVPILDQEPLLEVLAFYEQGLAAGVFAPELLNVMHAQEYWQRFTMGEITLAATHTTLYLQDQPPESLVAPFPMLDESQHVIIEGWVWALTTTNPNQQMGALQFIEYMMSAEALADFTQTLGVLPARRRALRIWVETPYLEQVESWLANGLILPNEQRNNIAAEQLQAAVLAVLNGMPYEEAAQTARSALSSSG